MSDRFTVNVNIKSTPEDPQALADFLNHEMGFSLWESGFDWPDLVEEWKTPIEKTKYGYEVFFDGEYTNEEDLVKALIEEFPNLAFDIWSDPKYEYLGGLYVRRPKTMSGNEYEVYECDSTGNAVVHRDDVRRAFAGAVSDLALNEALDSLFGKKE